MIVCLDVSSRAAGYASMELPERLVDVGCLRPPGSWTSVDRIDQMVDQLAEYLALRSGATVVMEWSDGKVAGKIARRMRRTKIPAHLANAIEVGTEVGGDVAIGSGLSVLGAAQGAVRQMCRHQGFTIATVGENQWTRGKPKAKRAEIVRAVFPAYAALEKDGLDPGLDAADAIGIGLWYLAHLRITERTC